MIIKNDRTIHVTKNMKFIADAMLGRLAKWLRLLGFDVVYYPDIEDRQVIKISREEARIILTRDTGLMKRKGLIPPVFIRSDKVFDQLREMKRLLNFNDADPLGRYVVCNGTMEKVSHKAAVRELVPDFIYHTFHDFIKCSGCGKVYWKGTHHEKIREKSGEVVKADGED